METAMCYHSGVNLANIQFKLRSNEVALCCFQLIKNLIHITRIIKYPSVKTIQMDETIMIEVHRS